MKKKIAYKIISSVTFDKDIVYIDNRIFTIDEQIYNQIKKSNVKNLRLIIAIFMFCGSYYIRRNFDSFIILLIYLGINIFIYHFIIDKYLVRKLPDNIFDYLVEIEK